MNAAALALRHSRAAVLLAGALVIGGVLAAFSLPSSIYPPLEFPPRLPLPEPSEPIEVESMLSLTPGQLIEARGEQLTFAFADGSQLRRAAGGLLSGA